MGKDPQKGKSVNKGGMGQGYKISQKKDRAAKEGEPCVVIALYVGAVTASLISGAAAAAANYFI
jgi:hypothetical protein